MKQYHKDIKHMSEWVRDNINYFIGHGDYLEKTYNEEELNLFNRLVMVKYDIKRKGDGKKIHPVVNDCITIGYDIANQPKDGKLELVKSMLEHYEKHYNNPLTSGSAVTSFYKEHGLTRDGCHPIDKSKSKKTWINWFEKWGFNWDEEQYKKIAKERGWEEENEHNK